MTVLVTLGIVAITFANVDHWPGLVSAVQAAVLVLIAAGSIWQDHPKGYVQRVALGDLGFVMFFADDYAGSLAPFDAALAIDPEFKHLNPWRIVALERLGKSNGLKDQFKASLSKDYKSRTWVDHVVAYLLGAESEGELLAAAQTVKEPLKTDETCEACYFIGLTRARF